MKKILLLSALFVSLFGSAQETFKYRRALSGIRDQWHRIVLPDEVFGKLENPMNDLRILGLTKDGDTVEAPFIYEIARTQEFLEIINYSDLNPVTKDGFSYFTLKVQGVAAINHIELQFHDQNFNWNIHLEGSQDQRNWYTILREYKILSIHEQHADYDFTSLYFPDCSFRYYRIGIPTEQLPELIQAGLWRQIRKAGVINQYTPLGYTVSQKDHQTIVDIEFARAVPIDWMQVKIAADYDFYRPCTVFALDGDSLSTQEKYRSYRRVTSAVLSSAELSGIAWEGTHLSKYWRLVINNFDNEALEIAGISCTGPQHSLTARFTSKADYFLFYGNENVGAPVYDLAYYSEKIPENPDLLKVEKEESLMVPEIIEEPILSSKWWLWTIMGVVILMLGGFTLRMLKSTRLKE